MSKDPIVQVRITMPDYFSPGFVTFRRQFDIDNDLHGKTWRAPEPTSWARLARVLYDNSMMMPALIDVDQGEIVCGDQAPMPMLFSYLAGKDK